MTAQQETQIYDGPERRADPHLTLKSTIKAAFKEALEETMTDKDLVKSFWKSGYNELSDHTGNSAKQWLGGRLMQMLALAAFAWAVKYLVQSGAIK